MPCIGPHTTYVGNTTVTPSVTHSKHHIDHRRLLFLKDLISIHEACGVRIVSHDAHAYLRPLFDANITV